MCLFGVAAGIGSYLCFESENTDEGIALAVMSTFLLIFAAFGVRRTYHEF